MTKQIIASIVLGMALITSASGISWDDFDFSMEERERTENGEDTLVDMDFSDDAQWKKMDANSKCVKYEEDGTNFVRMVDWGKSNGVGLATNCVISPGEVIYVETLVRVPHASTNCVILYVQMFDKKGKLITEDPGVSQGWSYSSASYASVRYPIYLDMSNTWQKLSYKMIIPEGVYSIKPITAMWRGTELDCRQIGVRTTGSVYSTNAIDLGAPISADENSRTYLPANKNLKIDLKTQLTNGQWQISAAITDLNSEIVRRCFDMHLKWKHALTGWTWHKDWMNDVEIAASSELFNTGTVGGFKVSRYSITAVSSADGSERYFFGTPLDESVYERRVITADGIESSQPLGIWVRGDIGKTSVFRWLFAEFDGDWGFRSATKEYLRTQSSLMSPVGIGRKEGCWIWPEVAVNVPDPDDFGLYFWEAGKEWREYNTNAIHQAHEKGFEAFPYIEPWGMRVTIGAAGVTERTGMPTVDDTLASINSWATNDAMQSSSWFSTNKQDAAKAFLNSMPYQPNGKVSYSEDYYDSWARWMKTVPDPNIAHPNVFDTVWIGKTGIAHDIMDGIYFDSVGYVDYRNEREDHLKVFTHPLIYDTEMMRPCSDGMMHQHDCISYVANELHTKNQRAWCNIFDMCYRFDASIVDIFGSEIGTWGSDNNTNVSYHARMLKDSTAGYYRFYAYHRPISNLLQDGSWTQLTPETPHECILAYIENHMLYGVYPGVTTIGGEQEGEGYANWRRYFDTRKRYERDRDIFKAAIPVIRRMNKAGWEPETGLVANTNVVRIERYGSRATSEMFFAVHNDSSSIVTARLSRATAEGVEFDALVPVYHGETLQATADGEWTVEIAPWQTLVVARQNVELSEAGEHDVHGSGVIKVNAAVELSGVYEGALFVASGASVKFPDVRITPSSPPVMETGTGNILWFDPSRDGAVTMAKPAETNSTDKRLIVSNAANPGWYDLKGGGRSPTLVKRAVENGDKLPWLDYDANLEGRSMGRVMRFDNDSSSTNYLFGVRTGFIVLDTSCGGGNPLIDTALAGYPGSNTYLRRRTYATAPVFLAKTGYEFVTNSPTFLNSWRIDAGVDTFNKCGEVLSFDFSESLPVKAFGDYSDATSAFSLRHGEVLLYRDSLTLWQRRDTEAYLMNKWLGKTASGYGCFTNLVVHGDGIVTLPANRECWPIIASDFTGTIVVEDEPPSPTGNVWTLPDATLGATFAIQMTNAVTQAASNDTIFIKAGYYSMEDVYMTNGTYASASGDIAWNVHICPNGKVLHFEGESQGEWDGLVTLTGTGCFYKRVSSGDDGTTFKGITFKGFIGSAQPNITPSSGNLQANSLGGAIRGNKSIVAENCVFEKNYARVAGAVDGISCTNCQFVGNHAAYAGGAAHGGCFIDCEFKSNHADSTGGALWWASQTQGCHFEDNYAISTAGAVNMEGRSAVSNCVFSGNWVKNDAGGAIQLRPSCTVVDCTFVGNTSKNHGAAIYGYPNDSTGNGGDNAFICRCTFKGKSAGMVSVVRMPATGQLVDCRFEGNIISNKNQPVGLVSSSSSSNDWSRYQLSGCSLVSNIVWKGGIVSDFACTNCEFSVNEVPYSGAVVYRSKAVDCRLLGNRKLDSYYPTGETKYSGALAAGTPGCDGHSSQFVACTMDGGVINNCVLNRCVIPSCTNAGSYCVFYGGGNHVTNTLVTGRLGNRSSGTAFRGIIYDWGGPSEPSLSTFANCTFADLEVDNWRGDTNLVSFVHKGEATNGTYAIDFVNCICHGFDYNGVTKDWTIYSESLTNGVSGVAFYNCMASVYTNLAEGVEWSNFVNNLELSAADQQLVLTDEEMAADGMPRYSPQLTSPACQIGDTTGFAADDTDLAGALRMCNGKIDLGCYQVVNVNIRASDRVITIPVSAAVTNTLAQALAKAGLTIDDLNGGDYADYTIVKQGGGVLAFPTMAELGSAAFAGWTGDLLIAEGVVKVQLPVEPSDSQYGCLLGKNSVGKIVVANGASLYLEISGNTNVGSYDGITRPIYLAGEGTTDYPGALTMRSSGSSSTCYRRVMPNTIYLNDDATMCFLRGNNSFAGEDSKNRYLCGHTLTIAAQNNSVVGLISTAHYYPGATANEYDARARAIFDNIELHSRSGIGGLFRNYSEGNEIVFRNGGAFCCNGAYAYCDRWTMVIEATAAKTMYVRNYGVAGSGIATNGAGMFYGEVVLQRDLTITASAYGEEKVAQKDHNTGLLGAISGSGGLTMAKTSVAPYTNSVLSLAGANTFTGPLTLSAITLALFNEQSIPHGEDAGLVTLKNCDVALCYPQGDAGVLTFPETVIEGAGEIHGEAKYIGAARHRVAFKRLTKTGEGEFVIDERLFGGDLAIQCGTVKVVNVGSPLSTIDALTGAGVLDLDGGTLVVGSLDLSQGLQIVNGDVLVFPGYRWAEAANATNLAWLTTSEMPWVPVWTTNAADGVHALQSGAVSGEQASVIAMQAAGAGTLTFDWRIACASRGGMVTLEVDGEELRTIRGTVDWAKVAIELGAGDHVVRWIYRNQGRGQRLESDCAWLDNVSWTLAPPPTLAEALDNELEWTTDGDGEWTAIRDTSAAVDDDFAYVAGLGDCQAATLRTTISGAGRLKFRWAVSCEEYYDWFEFVVDGEIWRDVTGETDWRVVTVDVDGGPHAFEWVYWKDNLDDAALVGANCAMLDGVVWTPADELQPELREVSLSEFYAWLKGKGLLAANAALTAALPLATTAAPCKTTTLIEEYIVGTDPNDADDNFAASITLVDGKPVVTWTPDLNGDGDREGERVYRIYGTNDLSDDASWVEVAEGQEASYRFFKVSVEMP